MPVDRRATILGVLACGAVVRREAYLAAGGFFYGEAERHTGDREAAGDL